MTSARAGECLADRPLAAFVALGELDFAFAGEQRHGAHLAQVHADGIVGFVAGFLGKFQIAEIVGFFFGFLEVELGLFQNLDAGAVEIGKQVFELAAGGKLFGEQLVDFVVQNEPFFFARFHEIFQPAVLVICCHWHPAYQR